MAKVQIEDAELKALREKLQVSETDLKALEEAHAGLASANKDLKSRNEALQSEVKQLTEANVSLRNNGLTDEEARLVAEKTAAGLPRQDAINVVRAQQKHDAALKEHKQHPATA